MTVPVLAGAGSLILLVSYSLWRLASKSKQLDAAIDSMRASGTPSPVVAVISQAPEDERPNLWNQAVSKLWQTYDRREAAQLVVEAVKTSDATILQYWMNQILEVEPDIASEVFDQEFIDEHYDPDVASRCGPSGCCG